jgi:hypothetical protein
VLIKEQNCETAGTGTTSEPLCLLEANKDTAKGSAIALTRTVEVLAVIIPA